MVAKNRKKTLGRGSVVLTKRARTHSEVTYSPSRCGRRCPRSSGRPRDQWRPSHNVWPSAGPKQSRFPPPLSCTPAHAPTSGFESHISVYISQNNFDEKELNVHFCDVIVIPSFLPLQQPAASWHLRQRPVASRSCDFAPSPPPTTQVKNLKWSLFCRS